MLRPLPKLKRVAAYARVSSGKDAMLHSLSAQVSYYSQMIQQHPGWQYIGVFTDEAKTGTKDSREGFQRLLETCRDGRVDLVITKSISRFARNTVTLLETIRELKSLGIDVFFEEQNIHAISSDGEAEVCPDHVHMLVEIPPKMSVSSFMGYLKGKSMRTEKRWFRRLKTTFTTTTPNGCSADLAS